MAGNKNLHRANREKNDEFYTRLVDIENELRHYTQHFKDKIIFCNCDDPEESIFSAISPLNFDILVLKINCNTF
ncbi:adenine-specific methyltransferase EcoRI family protein [Glaesserella parasuis]|uniref:adenine-specific methyltransferase EcoRI family protein n=1 Tax=Glaesserella parasuis TaxID=738 RepID=UPI00191655C7|nr:adenine-specific methyltransferase EcoRI family protein [Glaesserella parasuis]